MDSLRRREVKKNFSFVVLCDLRGRIRMTMASLLLHEFHQAAGGRFTAVHGEEAVGDYGNSAAEYSALREGAGILDLSFRGRLCALGADAIRFLNGQVTNNVKDLKVGEGCYAGFVSAKGKLQGDANIYRLENEVLLDFEPGFSLALSERLEKFVVAEEVEIIDAAPHFGLLSVQGPKAAALLADFSLPTKVMGISQKNELYVTNRSRAFDLFVPLAEMKNVARRLQEAGGILCGWQALETVRIEDGIPRFGADMDDSNLAPEALGNDAISYAKGCYIGQEVIARIRTYGQVAKALRQLRLAKTDEIPARGAKIFLGEKEVGYATSAVHSPRWGTGVALGYIRREANQPGSVLQIEISSGKISGEVVDKLPLSG
jgi:folate-binding protein YgfZ